MKNQLPLVTIIGRTNVGKSTLFNRLVGDRRALVSSIAGTTRDARQGECFWAGQTFTVVDTAGLDVEGEAAIDVESIKMARRALKKSDAIILLVDGRAGFTAVDKAYAREILKTKKPAMLAVNKVDSMKQLHLANDFYKSGFKNVEIVSAKNGSGTGDLLDTLLRLLPNANPSPTADTDDRTNEIRVAIIGKPNVGKSSLFNKIIGEERSVVSPVPHTTRDSQDVTIEYVRNQKIKKLKKQKNNSAPNPLISESVNQSTSPEGVPSGSTSLPVYQITFIDTAGLIKQRKINDKLQEISMEQSRESMQKSDVVLLVIDVTEPITQQDKHLAEEILESGRSLIFVVNKWDEVEEKDEKSDHKYIHYLQCHFPFLTWAPIIFVSALTGFKVSRLIDTVIEVAASQRRPFTDEELENFLRKILRKKSPPRTHGKRPPFIKSIRRLPRRSLVFMINATGTDQLVVPYLRFMENALREEFKLWGCGIKLILEEEKGKIS